MAISSDTLICRQVEAALDQDSRTKDATIDVACMAGMVSLTREVTGMVSSVGRKGTSQCGTAHRSVQ